VGAEALAETLAVEAGQFGIEVAVLEPGSVSSGGAERAMTYPGGPYEPPALLPRTTSRSS
jgi:NAD(P)-dependent dehydrogenase (short-subunit alcohol dehydrogenase family)